MCSFIFSLLLKIIEIYSKPYPYNCTPSELMDHVLCHVRSCDTTTWPESLNPSLELLHKYQEMIADLNESDELLRLGLGLSDQEYIVCLDFYLIFSPVTLLTGIDTDQFESDPEYKHSIILMLARYVHPLLLEF